MFKDGFNHAAVMHALTQPQSLININTRPHITSLRIKGTYRYDHEDEDLNVDEDNSFLRSRSERLRARYGAQKIDDSCSNPPIYSQTDNDHFSPMAISTSNAKEVDKNLVEFLKNKEQDNSKTVMYESIMSFILDKLQSNSEKDCGYKYTFLCGCEYLGQVINDTHLTSLSFKNTDMTNDWLYNFAKHLPTSHIASLVLPRIIDDLQTIDEKYKKEDISSDTDSSHEDVKCRTKKPKITEDDTSCNEKIVNNGLEYLASILKDTEIRCLDFGGNHVNLKMLSCSLVGSKLTSLSLRSCKIQNDGLSFLARILKDTLINSIDLSENELDCQHLKIFVPGLEGTNITSLNLSFNKIGVDGMDCLASVLKTTEVAVLDISDNNLTCKSIEVFLNHLVDSKITSLSLKNNYIGTDGLSCLGRVLKNTQITSLDVSGIEFNSEIMEMFASSLTDTKITFLGLERNYIDIDELCMLLDVMGNTRITSINLHNNDWDLDDKNPDGINRLERLLTNPQITSINIGNGDRFNLFASSLIGSNITYLGLKEQSLSINELELLGDVLKNSKISSIDLSDNELDEESFKVLVPLLVDSKITSLNLSGNSPYYDGINCLGSALKNTKIISLSLSNCSMSCNTVRHFVMYLPDSKIKSLDLSGNVLCCNSFYLAFILKHTQITTLDISSQQFKEYNVDPICLLQLFKSIDTSLHLIDRNLCTTNWYFLALNLSNTGINSLKVTDGGTDSEELKYLCQGLLNSQVVDLDLTRNNIDCSKVYYLAKVLKHTRISSLNLAKNEIEDEGIKYLTKELVGSKLKSLDLYQNFISDAGIQGLAESLVGTHLLELNLRDNRISSDSAYNLSESVEKSNLKSMHIQIDFRVKKVYVDLNVFKYENCLIDIVESFSSEGIDDFVKKVYQKAGITQLILEGEEFPHLAGAFDNMNIDEVVIAKLFEDEESEVISCLENSNIGELKIEWCDLSPNYFEKMKVIALQIQNDHNAAPDDETLQLSLMKSNIVYLDLSGIEIDEIEFPTLVDALPGSKIISLNLSGNEIGRSGIKSLAKVLPATNITYINLDDNFIGLRGFKYLMNVAKNTKLCWLSLKNNGIEKDFGGVIQLSPFIVPRIDNPIEFQIRYLFKELVTLNPSTEQFEFILPRDGSHTTIIHYPRLVKLLLDKSIYKMHIYDYFYMQSEKHSLHLLNSINAFVEQIKPNFISFFESNIMQLDEMFGYDSFVSLVVEFNRSNLNEFVEFLLLHRVLYYVDDEKNFLHPLVYKMLLEHNMPIFIEEIEPNKKQQIITYFEKHTELEGAQEIIDLLK